jgi:hypothetical protein
VVAGIHNPKALPLGWDMPGFQPLETLFFFNDQFHCLIKNYSVHLPPGSKQNGRTQKE